MKAIILAGGDNGQLSSLTHSRPKALLPFLARPLLETQLRALKRQGFDRIGLAVSAADRSAVESEVGDGSRFGVRLTVECDDHPRGPAGCLKLFKEFIGTDSFLVVNACVFLGTIDLGALIDVHDHRGAAATLGMARVPGRCRPIENLVVSPEGRVQGFRRMHAAWDRRQPRRFGGVCFFDPRVLEYVPDDGFMDIKEQLILALCQAGLGVFEKTIGGVWDPLDDVDGYYRAHQVALQTGASDLEGYRQIGPRVWAGEGVSVAPSANILGGVLLGANVVIREHAQVVGPAVLGDGCVVGAGSMVRESVVWERAQIGQASSVEYSVIGDRVVVEPGASESGVVLMPHHRIAMQRDDGGYGFSAASTGADRPAVRRGSGIGKRVLDVFLALAGLALTWPFFVVLAILIRLDSRGPVFFRQRRCGIGGKEFWMIKFRTMVADAERHRPALAARNDVDGPVFKMFDDPRVTRVGRVLRRTSLDELPQLLNILRGDMSLVGPRPLAAEELRFSPTWRDFRLTVKPGLTGLWQIHGRSRTGFHEWVRHDIAYVKRRSFWFDLKILFKTAWIVLRGI